MSSLSKQAKPWNPPPYLIEAAEKVMGGIDTHALDLESEWRGRVWLAMPRTNRLEWARRFVADVQAGKITEAVVLANNSTDTRWWQALASVSCAGCLHTRRVRFLDEHNEPTQMPTQGQILLYFGGNRERFKEVFSAFGSIVYPI